MRIRRLLKYVAVEKFCGTYFFNLLTTNVPPHIDISQLICIADQLTGFYMMGNIGR